MAPSMKKRLQRLQMKAEKDKAMLIALAALLELHTQSPVCSFGARRLTELIKLAAECS